MVKASFFEIFIIFFLNCKQQHKHAQETSQKEKEAINMTKQQDWLNVVWLFWKERATGAINMYVTRGT